MFSLFKRTKEKSEVTQVAENAAAPDEESDEDSSPKRDETPSGENVVALTKLSTDVDRMKASIESFSEVRKSLTERMSGMSEQIGELRAMIMDRDRSIRDIELKAVKAADLVEAVQPEKLMISVQREDAKIEALKANLEGNESIMDRVMQELKEMRKKIEFFRDLDETIKLAEEVRKELIEMKKVEASIHINAEKVDTLYTEIRKKYKELDAFNGSLQELRVSSEQHSKDLDILKTKIGGLADKDELDKIMTRVQKYADALKDLSKTSALSKDVSELKKMLELIR